jgi:hypothetical protein
MFATGTRHGPQRIQSDIATGEIGRARQTPAPARPAPSPSTSFPLASMPPRRASRFERADMTVARPKALALMETPEAQRFQWCTT